MEIKKGQLLEVSHQRKGAFKGIAMQDFDTEKDEFYPVAVAQKKMVKGMVNAWEEGQRVPCRNCLCSITKIEK